MYGVYLAFAITSLREVDIAQMQNTSNDREHSIGFVLVKCQQPVRKRTVTPSNTRYIGGAQLTKMTRTSARFPSP